MGYKVKRTVDTMDTLSEFGLFLFLRRFLQIVCISWYMNKYAYQIQGALEDRQGQFLGLRILICDVNHFETVDVPVEVLDDGTVRYLEFRLRISETMDIRKLPIVIQNRIRTPLGRWLDRWVLNNFYGDTLKRTSSNTWLLEASP